MNSPQLELDKSHIQQFLILLDEETDTFCFQTFDDDKKRKDRKLAAHRTGTLDDVFPWLVAQQNKGAGAFVTVNETDGKGRKKENITRIRCVFLEDDGDSVNAANLPTEPHIIVSTSPGKQHSYILTDGGNDFDGFGNVIDCITTLHGGDRDAKDISRVLRLPGTYHLKDSNKPHPVRMIHTSGDQPLEWDKVKELFPAPHAPVVAKSVERLASLKNAKPALDLTATEIKRLLRRYGLNDYGKWLNAGFALHHQFNGEPEGLEIWDEISSEFNSYEAGDCEAKWATFNGDLEHTEPLTFATIIYGAEKLSYDDLMEEIDQTPEDAPYDLIKCLIRDCATMPPVEKERCHKAIKKRFDITLGTIREETREIANDTKEGTDHLTYAHTTLKNIERDNIIYSEGLTRRYANGVWRIVEDKEIKQEIHRVLSASSEEVISGMVNGILDVFLTEIYRDASHRWNREKNCVNVLNGELHYDDMGIWLLKPHNRENYSTSQLQIEYDHSAKAPRFKQFLDEIFNNDPDKEQKKRLILEMLGYSLQTHCKEEKFIILIGEGSNGKSELMRVLTTLAGDNNTVAVQPSEFGNKFQRAHLTGKLVNVVTELKRGSVMDDDAVKSITSGEATTVERKNKDPYQMEPYATCWFGTNHLPHTQDYSEALFRRAFLVPFNNIFTDATKDKTLRGKLEAETQGILTLALNAYANVIETGSFTEPLSCKQAKQNWRMDVDQVEMFLNDELDELPGNEISVSLVFDKYREWANVTGIKNQLGLKAFRERILRKQGIESVRRSNARMFAGIKFKQFGETGLNHSVGFTIGNGVENTADCPF